MKNSSKQYTLYNESGESITGNCSELLAKIGGGTEANFYAMLLDKRPSFWGWSKNKKHRFNNVDKHELSAIHTGSTHFSFARDKAVHNFYHVPTGQKISGHKMELMNHIFRDSKANKISKTTAMSSLVSNKIPSYLGWVKYNNESEIPNIKLSGKGMARGTLLDKNIYYFYNIKTGQKISGNRKQIADIIFSERVIKENSKNSMLSNLITGYMPKYRGWVKSQQPMTKLPVIKKPTLWQRLFGT